MSQVKGLVKILQIKIANITSQKDQLDDYVHKMISKARETLQTEEQDVNTLKDINSAMDIVWGYLVDITTHLEDVPSTTIADVTDQVSNQASSLSTLLSSSLPQLSSAILPTKSSEESQEISKLHNHMEVLEIALTTCRNEISQVNTDKNEVRDKLDKLENHIQKVETSHSHELDQKKERLASLEKQTQQTQSNMTKEIKDLQKTFKDNIRKTKQELDTRIDHMDEEFQKSQEQNMATIKEQASKLGKVEKKLKKMKEEEQERWSQIDSIHKDVETLKDAATDEQVQELIQTTTATSRSVEELTSKVEDTERSVRGCVAQRERDENRRREMEDRVAVLETRRQKDLDHYTKELEETNSLYKAVCQLVDQRVTPLRRLQRMLNDYHKQVEKREEISTRLDDVVKKVKDISTQLDKHESSKDIHTRGIRNAPRDQPCTKFFSSICRECTVCHDTGVVSYTCLSSGVTVGQFISASPLTPKYPSFSFEITNPGRICGIAIGVCSINYPPRRMPGWNPGSIAYHADDGGAYLGAPHRILALEKCGRGDIMKCELNFNGGSIKFFKNDRRMYESQQCQLDFANLHAAIGFASEGEAVRLLEKEPWQMN